MIFCATIESAECQETKIPALDAFKTCNAMALQKAPIKLSNGLVVTKIAKSKENGVTRIQLTFNKVADPSKENQAAMVKRITGYDFTDLDKYEIDEADGGPWIACHMAK
jgi:hypothetical protein